MIILIVILVGIALYGVKASSFQNDYLSKETTSAIKGFFALVILFSHMNGYIVLNDSIFTKPYVAFIEYLGQAMVAMYFFYSGYGIMESIAHKPHYKDSFLKKRILKTLFHFDLAVLLFLLYSFLSKRHFPISYYFTCWIGWDSIGNSNWFIFDILALYLLIYAVLQFCSLRVQKDNPFSLALIIVGTFLLWCFLYFTKKGASWWINTLFTFPLGIGYSKYKERFEYRLKQNTKFFPILAFLTALLVIWHWRFGVDGYGFYSCLFAIWIVLVTTRIKFNNSWLQWLGTNAFSIYILQRLPMNFYSHIGLNENVPLFVCLSILTVLLLSWIFGKALNFIDSCLFN